MTKFIIHGRLSGLNEYVESCRMNKYGANSLKKKNERIVAEWALLNKVKPIENYPVKLHITWYEPNNKRDIDNITFGVKFILDSLVKCQILKDDSQKYVTGIEHEVKTDKTNPRIEVEIDT